MKKHTWRKSFYLIIPFLLFLCSGIWFYQQKNAFRSFCNDFFMEEVSKDTLGLHYTLAYPDAFGMKTDNAELPVYDKNAALENYTYLQNKLDTLASFSPEKLSDEEKYTQKLLLRSLEHELDSQQFFYLQDVFSPAGGIQIQYPILMAEYTFRCKQDIEDYLQLIKQTPEYFSGYFTFSKEKQERGFGSPDFSLQKVISQCETIITPEKIADNSHFLITGFHERLETALKNKVITQKDYDHYSSVNKEFLSAYLLPAYTQLGKDLSTLLHTEKNENGLCYHKEGKDYYSWLFQQTTGSDTSVSDAYKILAKDYYTSMHTLQNDLITFQNTAALSEEDMTYFSLSDSDEMLDRLSEQMADSFPSIQTSFQIPSFQATVKNVSPSLEQFTAPAYYLVPPIDDNSQNFIYINQASAPTGLDLYTTLAHEGYPGHLYQTTYYQLYREKENLPYLRNILNYGGYVEGWALYVELLSFDYASDLLCEDTGNESYRLLYDIYKQERQASLALLSLLDIGVHYYGLTFERASELLASHGITDKNSCREIYEYIIEEPCNYPKYYWGCLEILSLKEKAREQMGEAYSDHTFHQFFLESGPSDFTSLRERFEKEYLIHKE